MELHPCVEGCIPIIATRLGVALTAPCSGSCSDALPNEMSRMARMEYRKRETCCGINARMIMVALENSKANW
jgi:hypothetical protein